LNSGKVIAVGAGSRGKDGNTIPVSVKEETMFFFLNMVAQK